MSSEIVTVGGAEVVVPLDVNRSVSSATVDLLAAAIPANTVKAYNRQWETFLAWCDSTGRDALPTTAENVAEYVTHMCSAEKSPATIDQAIAAIRHRHRGHTLDTSMARLMLRGYRRTRAESGQRSKQAAPAVIDTIRALVSATDPTTTVGLRDRAMIILGFALMGRRSELVALNISDVCETPEGLVVLIRASKTDQAGKGVEVPLPYGANAATCPVRTVRAWVARLADQGITDGPLLRSVVKGGKIGGKLSTDGANKALRTLATRAGIEGITMHSLRAGGATTAYKSGAPVSSIARHGRWAPNSPVVLGYIRSVDQWTDNPMTNVGL